MAAVCSRRSREAPQNGGDARAAQRLVGAGGAAAPQAARSASPGGAPFAFVQAPAAASGGGSFYAQRRGRFALFVGEESSDDEEGEPAVLPARKSGQPRSKTSRFLGVT